MSEPHTRGARSPRAFAARARLLPRAAIAALLLLGVLPHANPARAADDDPAGAPPVLARAVAWRDPATVAARLAEACDAVERATKATYASRPTARISTVEEVAAVLRAEFAPLSDAFGTPDAMDRGARIAAEMLVAKYEPATNRIHVVPDVVERMAGLLHEPVLLSEPALRVVLAHEAVHALDFPRWGWEAMRLRRRAPEAQRAFVACVEGHAQWVARGIAAGWGLTPAFDAFTRSITALPPIADPVMRLLSQTFAAEAGFGYVAGLRFFDVVGAARGLAGVDAVLKDPPTGTRAIEHPEEFLDPGRRAPAPDLEAALEITRPLLPPEWPSRSDRLLEGTLKTGFLSLPDDERAHALDGYEEGRILTAGPADGSAQIAVVALRFRDAAAARAFLAVERRVSESKDAAFKTGYVRVLSSLDREGAGTRDALPGFTAVKALAMGTQEIRVSSQIFQSGRCTFEFGLVNVKDLTRERVDPIADAAAAAVVEAPPR